MKTKKPTQSRVTSTPERARCSFVLPTSDGPLQCSPPWKVTPAQAEQLGRFVKNVLARRERMRT